MKKWGLLGLLGLLAPLPALAQQPVKIVQEICNTNNGTTVCNYVPVSATNPLNITGSVTGTFSATLGGFSPSTSGARMTPLSVTTSDSSGTLPTGTVVVVSNVGANPMYCNVNGVAATTSDQPINTGVGNWFAFTIPTGVTVLHCIATGGSTTANGVGGSGLATGAGGGGGSGGGGAITAASGSYSSGALSSGSIASGALASGSISSGAAVSGAFVAGAIADLAHGQGTMAQSVPVAIASNQSSFAVTGSGVFEVGPTTSANTVANPFFNELTTGTTAIGQADNAAWTAGTTPQISAGCEYTSGGATALTTGHAGTPGCTSARGIFTDKSSVSGTALGAVVSALGTLAGGTPNVENVNAYIVGGAGSGGTSLADNGAWTAGTTSFTPSGCEYTSGGATAITTAHAATVGCTTGRAFFTDKSSVNGTALGAVVSNLGTLASGTPAAENVNVYIVGCVSGGAPCNSNGSATSANSTPVVIASDQAAVAIKAASGAFASGALASGSIASGAAVSGAFVAGAIADLAHGQGTMAASVPVAIASNQSAVPISAASASIASGAVASGAVASGAFASGSISSGAIASGAIAAGASAGDPCVFGTKTNLAISTNATALTQVIAASGSTKIYICSISLIAAGATAFNLNTGTATNCGSTTAALIGSTTAANGMSFAANGGLTLGNGSGVVAVSAASSELCTLQSNAVYVSGNLTYVQQ